MNNEFIPFEQALALKELGFNEPCFAHFVKHDDEIKCILDSDDFDEWWTNNSDNLQVKAPLYQQAFRWFREEHNVLGNVYSNASGWLWEIHDDIGGTHRFGSEYSGDCEYSGAFTSFRKAEIACLDKLIELLKKK